MLVGQVTDYDKLSIDVTTDGTISPELGYVGRPDLQDQLQLFISFEEPRLAIREETRDELPFNKNCAQSG